MKVILIDTPKGQFHLPLQKVAEQFNTEFYMETNTSLNNETPPAAKPLLGVVVSDLASRVIEKPFYTEWDYPSEWGGGTDSIREKGKLNYEGLNDHEKMILYIYAWNLSDICPTKKSVMKEFGWSAYKVAKMYRELKQYGLKCVALFSENTGLLRGRGYRYYYA